MSGFQILPEELEYEQDKARNEKLKPIYLRKLKRSVKRFDRLVKKAEDL